MMMRHLLALGVCIAFAAPSYGQVISVSFAGDNAGGNAVSIGGFEPTSEVAGVVPVANWNSDDELGLEGFLEDLFDDSGDVTSAAVEWAGSNNTWGGTGATTEDEMMVNGWLDDNGSGALIEVSGIPYETYDVYVYGSSDAGNAGRGFTTQVNDVDYFSNGVFEDPISDNGSFFDPEIGYINAVEETSNPTYFKIDGLSGDELTIFGARNQVGPEEPNGITDFRGGVSGFQIVEVTESACDPNTMGDIDGSGDIAFADFLILSANFGQAATDQTTGDIDCSGDVAFADFLILSANFGQTVGGAASVPEPSGFALLGFAGLFGGLLRRRR